MTARKLAEIAYESETGLYKRVSDGEVVNPDAHGKIIQGLVVKEGCKPFGQQDPVSVYDVARDGARKQNLWDVVNAYSASTQPHNSHPWEHAAIHLFKI